MSANEVSWYRRRFTGVKLQRYWQVAIGTTILFGAVIVPSGFSYWTEVIRRQRMSSVNSKDDIQRQVLERRQHFRRMLKDSEIQSDSNAIKSPPNYKK